MCCAETTVEFQRAQLTWQTLLSHSASTIDSNTLELMSAKIWSFTFNTIVLKWLLRIRSCSIPRSFRSIWEIEGSRVDLLTHCWSLHNPSNSSTGPQPFPSDRHTSSTADIIRQYCRDYSLHGQVNWYPIPRSRRTARDNGNQQCSRYVLQRVKTSRSERATSGSRPSWGRLQLEQETWFAKEKKNE